jgi:hypothetical protein
MSSRSASGISLLQAMLGERLSTSASQRKHHGRDLTWHPASPPDAVAFAGSTEEVAASGAPARNTDPRWGMRVTLGLMGGVSVSMQWRQWP